MDDCNIDYLADEYFYREEDFAQPQASALPHPQPPQTASTATAAPSQPVQQLNPQQQQQNENILNHAQDRPLMRQDCVVPANSQENTRPPSQEMSSSSHSENKPFKQPLQERNIGKHSSDGILMSQKRTVPDNNQMITRSDNQRLTTSSHNDNKPSANPLQDQNVGSQGHGGVLRPRECTVPGTSQIRADNQGMLSSSHNIGKSSTNPLLNQNMSHTQEGALMPQDCTIPGTNQMTTEANSRGMLSSTDPLLDQNVLSQNHDMLLVPQDRAAPGTNQMSNTADNGQFDQTAMVTEEPQRAGTIQTINGNTYTSSFVGSSQPAGGSSISAFPLGQNVITASPGTPQQTGSFNFTSARQVASGMGQNNVTAAPGQPGGYFVQQETSNSSGHPQQTMTPSIRLDRSCIPYTVTFCDGSSVVLATPMLSATLASASQLGGKPDAVSLGNVAGGISIKGGTIQTEHDTAMLLPAGTSIAPLQNTEETNTSTASPEIKLTTRLDKIETIIQMISQNVNNLQERTNRVEVQVRNDRIKANKIESVKAAKFDKVVTLLLEQNPQLRARAQELKKAKRSRSLSSMPDDTTSPPTKVMATSHGQSDKSSDRQ